MKAAGLKAIDTVVQTTAVLIKSRKTQNELVDLISSRIRGVIGMSISNFFPFLLFFRLLTASAQMRKNTSFVNTTFLVKDSRPPRQSLRANVPPLSPL